MDYFVSITKIERCNYVILGMTYTLIVPSEIVLNS